MHPELLKYIKEGEVIILSIILALIIAFFKFRVPRIQIKLDQKRDVSDCENMRENCNMLVLQRLDAIREHFNTVIDGINDKIDTIIENQERNAEKLEKTSDRWDRFLKLNGPK